MIACGRPILLNEVMKHPLSMLVLAIAAPAIAEELRIEKAPFTVTASFDATFLPAKAHPLRIDPEAWTDFTIVELVDQGGTVKKGEPVVVLDTEELDRQIAGQKLTARLRELALAEAERELATLETSVPRELDSARRLHERAREDLAYFENVGRPLREEQARRSVEQAERYLEYATEELEQLLKMYKEDDLTEETEEIILKRQRSQVDDAQFHLKQARITSRRTLETALPREAVDAGEALKTATLAWETQRDSLPRSLEQKHLDVKKLRTENQRAAGKDAELRRDRDRMHLRSPAKGRVYHGEIGDGRWDAGSAAKFMKPGGKIPPRTVFATVVPDDVALELDAFVEETEVARLEPGQSGFAAPAAAPHSRVPVTVTKVASHPGLDRKFRVVLAPGQRPAGLDPVPGMKGRVVVTVYDVPEAIAIPSGALHEEADGSYTVLVKTGRDETNSAPVEAGMESNGKVEIRSGLEPGQVVVVPAESEKS